MIFKSGYLRAAGIQRAGNAKGTPGPVWTIAGTPSLWAVANTKSPSSDKGLTPWPMVCSLIPTNFRSLMQRSISRSYASWSRCGVTLAIPKKRPGNFAHRFAMRSCVFEAIVAPGYGCMMVASTPHSSMRRRMSSSVASRPKTQHSPRWAWVSILLVMNPLVDAGVCRRSGHYRRSNILLPGFTSMGLRHLAQLGIQHVLLRRDPHDHQLQVGRPVVYQGVRFIEANGNPIALVDGCGFAIYLHLAIAVEHVIN